MLLILIGLNVVRSTREREAEAGDINQRNQSAIMRLLDEIGPSTDFVSAGDDLGWSQAPYMASEDFRNLIKPFQ